MPPGTPDCCIVRIVECLEGRVEMRTELAIRFDYGVTIPWVSRRDRRTMTAVAGPHLLTLRTAADVHGENMHSVAKFALRKGETMPFALAYGESFRPVPQAIDAYIAWMRPSASGKNGRTSARSKASGAARSCARC